MESQSRVGEDEIRCEDGRRVYVEAVDRGRSRAVNDRPSSSELNTQLDERKRTLSGLTERNISRHHARLFKQGAACSWTIMAATMVVMLTVLASPVINR